MSTFNHPIRTRSPAFLLVLATIGFITCLHLASAAACEIAVVVSADLKPYREVLRGLREAGVCSVQEVRLGDGDTLDRIRRTGPDAVIAIGTEAFRRTRSLRNLPLVHVMVIPAEANRRNAGHRPGVSMDISPATWLGQMARLFPEARTIGVLYDRNNTGALVSEALRDARASGISLIARPVRGPDDVPGALRSMQKGIDILWMLPDPTIAAPPTVEYLIRYSIQHRLPIVTFSKKYLEMGAVASLDVDPRDMGEQAAELVRRILRDNASPGREYARKIHVTVNRSAAEKMEVVINDRASHAGEQHE